MSNPPALEREAQLGEALCDEARRDVAADWYEERGATELAFRLRHIRPSYHAVLVFAEREIAELILLSEREAAHQPPDTVSAAAGTRRHAIPWPPRAVLDEDD